MHRKSAYPLIAVFTAIFLGSQFFAPALAQVANGRATTAAPTYTNNSTAPLSLDTSGNLRTSGTATVTGTVSVGNDVTVQGDVANDAVDSGNPVKMGGLASTGPVAVAVGDRVNAWMSQNGATVISGVNTSAADDVSNTSNLLTIPSVSSGTGRYLGIMPYMFDGTAWDRVRGTSAAGLSVSILSAIPAGTNNIGDVDVLTLPSIPAGTNNIGDVDVLTLPNVTFAPVSSTGANASGSTSPSVIKASAGTVYAVGWSNPATAAAILRVYDNASACSGTIRVTMSIGTDATSSDNMSLSTPVAFANGITVCTNVGTAGVTIVYQ